MKYLGIDYGTKKIGIAISDDFGSVAFPKNVVPTKNLESVLDEILSKEKIAGFVIGYSTDQTGKDNSIVLSAQKLGDALVATYGFPVFYEKEFFTSVFARQFQRGKHETTARKVKTKEIGNVDAHAAAIMLQRFLDTQNRK